MEQHINQELHRIEKQPEPSSSLTLSKPISGLTEQENKIVALKYGSVRFGAMDGVDLILNAQAALLKLCVITGWQMPEDELQAILVDQFTKKLAESYRDVNAGEMEYAFRTYGTTVRDWGKQVNLSLIDEVMSPYLTSRREISEKEMQKTPLALPAPQEDLSDQAMEDWLDHTRTRVKDGKCMVDFVPLALYEWMKKKGRIVMARKRSEYLVKAAAFRQGRLTEIVQNENSQKNRDLLTAFMIMKQEGVITGDEVLIVENLAKRIILFDMLIV